MRNNVFPLVLIAIVSVLVACTPVQIDQPDQLIRGYLPSVERACLGAQNAQRLGTQQNNSTEYNCEPAGSGVIAKRDLSGDGTYLTPNNLPFSGEWAFNKEKTDKGKTRAPPKVCLALSGGGVRSASFSLGILKSLSLHDISTEDRKNLGDVDVVSSVSGGGYALAWLIMQYYHHRDDHTFSHKMLFSAAAENGSRNNSTDESQYIRYIAAHSNIITSTEYVSLLGANVVSAPVNFGLNGLFGSHTNTTPARSAYEKSLRKTYARDPSHPLSTVDDVSFNELLRYYDNHREDDAAVRAPFFIINTTAFIEEDIRHYGAALANSIYDFTILQYGSDALGRYVYPNTSLPELNKGAQFFAQDARTSYSGTLRDDHPMSFMRAISVSGAALDGSALVAGYSQRVLFSLLNVDLGFYINNPGLSPRTRQHRRFLPWPLYYFFGNYARDARGTDIYLSDGAHAENLGAFSLVRRLCKEIIVVDAEYDPSYVFEAYSLLKHNLSTQLGVSLRIKEIDDKLQFAEFTKKNECEYLDPQRRTECKTQKKCDDDVAKERNANLPKWNSKVGSCTSSPRWKYFAKHPVMDGDICCLPLATKEPTEQSIRVHYIKLAYDTICDDTAVGKKNSTSNSVSSYFCNKKGDRHPFPQKSTISQDYNEEDFRAYMTLGECVMNQAYWSQLKPEPLEDMICPF